VCGRFGLEPQYVQLALRYQAAIDAIDPGPRYNIAPTQPVAVVLENDSGRILTQYRWGLVPRWAKDPSVGNRMINARAETVATRPAFRDSLKSRRCIIPASRFYEWQKTDSRKVPHSIQRSDGYPMNLAGIWASWHDRETDEELRSCAIITTAANMMMRPLHDRMPVVLPDEMLGRWLDRELTDTTELRLMLQAPPDEDLYAYPISPLVNNTRNQGEGLIVPVGPPLQASSSATV